MKKVLLLLLAVTLMFSCSTESVDVQDVQSVDVSESRTVDLSTYKPSITQEGWTLVSVEIVGTDIDSRQNMGGYTTQDEEGCNCTTVNFYEEHYVTYSESYTHNCGCGYYNNEWTNSGWWIGEECGCLD